MGNVTRSLSRGESACRCGCGLRDPHPMLIAGIQETVDWLQSELHMPVRVYITGPCRCRQHNETLRDEAKRKGIVGPAENSRHLPGMETGYCEAHDCVFVAEWSDSVWERISISRVYEAAQKFDRFAAGGIGLYMDSSDGPRVHLDVRTTGPARWGRIDGREASLAAVLKAAQSWADDRKVRWKTSKLEVDE